ncbi:hypothetical protein FS749_012067, partial [Ceratobasidium sp. UAMH 11750]
MSVMDIDAVPPNLTGPSVLNANPASIATTAAARTGKDIPTATNTPTAEHAAMLPHPLNIPAQVAKGHVQHNQFLNVDID